MQSAPHKELYNPPERPQTDEEALGEIKDVAGHEKTHFRGLGLGLGLGLGRGFGFTFDAAAYVPMRHPKLLASA